MFTNKKILIISMPHILDCYNQISHEEVYRYELNHNYEVIICHYLPLFFCQSYFRRFSMCVWKCCNCGHQNQITVAFNNWTRKWCTKLFSVSWSLRQKPSMCAITYWCQRYYKNGVAVDKSHLVDHVGVTHHDVSGYSNKKWFIRIGIGKIPYM